MTCACVCSKGLRNDLINCRRPHNLWPRHMSAWSSRRRERRRFDGVVT